MSNIWRTHCNYEDSNDFCNFVSLHGQYGAREA